MRHYYRCADCMGVWAINGEQIRGVICDCDGRWLHMGQVQEDRLVQETSKTACDCRCTHASGPKCNCICKGINHGTGRVVKVLIDAGGIPRAIGLMQHYEERVQIASQWRRLLTLAENKAQTEKDHYKKYLMDKTLSKIKRYKSHNKRMETLFEFMK